MRQLRSHISGWIAFHPWRPAIALLGVVAISRIAVPDADLPDLGLGAGQVSSKLASGVSVLAGTATAMLSSYAVDGRVVRQLPRFRLLAVYRVLWSVGALLVAVAISLAGVSEAESAWIVVARVAGFAAVSTTALMLGHLDAVWIPPLIWFLAGVLFGRTSDETVTYHSWAFFLEESASGSVAAVSVLAWLMVSLSHCVITPRAV